MQNEKQNLISLSLAGSVGYYLYSKLASIGTATLFGSDGESASERTKRELTILKEPEVEEQPVEDIFSPPDEPVEEETPPAIEDETETKTEETPTVNDILDGAEEPVGDDDLLAPVDLTDEISAEDETMSIPDLSLDSELSPADLTDEAVPSEDLEEPKDILEEEPDTALPTEEPDDTNLDVSLLEQEDDTPVDTLFDAISEVDEEVNNSAPEMTEEPKEETKNETASEAEATMPDLDFGEPDTVEDISSGRTDSVPTLDTLDETEAANAPESNDISSESDNKESDDGKVMDNVEVLHPVDKKDEGTKAEFKSIMDFFSSL